PMVGRALSNEVRRELAEALDQRVLLLDVEVDAQERAGRRSKVDPVGSPGRLHASGGIHRVAPEIEQQPPLPDDAADHGPTGHSHPSAKVDGPITPPSVDLAK